jgi:hypothetical protein
VAPLYNEVTLLLATPLQGNTPYELKVHNMQDCAGNVIGNYNSTKAGLSALADSFSVVINELLFDPPPNGYDYIELYNRSTQVIDLKQLYVANRGGTGELTNVSSLSTVSWLLFPGEHRVFTVNKQWLQQQYLLKDAAVITEVPSLPSLPDDKGALVLLNMQGNIVDELRYDHSWHFALVNEKEGVALERINYNQPTQEKTNWTSAAATGGFGTPGSKNSQLMADAQVQGQFSVQPAVFSPDNDGFNDVTAIEYQLGETGYVANIRIFDINGRRVRNLVQNATLSTSGRFTWNGLDDQQNKLPIGNYIVLTELFNLQGKNKKFKQVVTLARRLQ